MDPVIIELSYVTNGEAHQHSFSVVGRVWGGSHPHIENKNEEGEVAYDLTPGIVAVVDYVGVIHNEG